MDGSEDEVGSSGIGVECSPGTFALMENNPEILEAALTPAGVLPEGGDKINEEEYFVPITGDNFGDFLSQEESREIQITESGTDSQEDSQENILTGTDDIKVKWLDAQVKLLLSLVEELRGKVGKTSKLSSKKKMWEEIEKQFKERGYPFSSAQIESKYRALEKQYKKCQTNNKLTGRNRLKCPYESEMSSILCKRPAVFPEKILGTKRKSPEISRTEVSISEKTTEQPGNVSGRLDVLRESSESRDSETPRKKCRTDLASELQKLRESKEDYFRKSLEMKAENYKKQQELKEEYYRRKEEYKEKKISLLKTILEELKKKD